MTTKILYMISQLELGSLYTLSTLAPSLAMTLYVGIRQMNSVV
jgi:hypothetical protein